MKVILLQDIKSLGKKGGDCRGQRRLRKKRPSEEKPRGRKRQGRT